MDYFYSAEAIRSRGALWPSFAPALINSWGGSKTSNETTKDETAIVFNKAAGRSVSAYPLYPVVYTTKDGTVKLSFSVPDPSDRGINPSGANTFLDLYGGRPDPALNLPSRLVPNAAGTGELEHWVANTGISRKKMRGLFFRDAKIDPTTGTYPLLGFTPDDGDSVRIEPRIYNYSTAQTAIGTQVEFQVIPYDGSLNSELCRVGSVPINAAEGVTTGLVCPRGDRQTIGKITVPRLEPRQFTCVAGFDDPAQTGCASPAFLDWDTTGFGPSSLGASEYRVYVVLNPDAPAGSEIYGNEPAPVTIKNITNATPMIVEALGNTVETGDYVTIGGVKGLNAANGTYRVTLLSEHRFSLDGTVYSRGSYTSGGTVSILDPGQNNEGFGFIAVARKKGVATTTAEELAPKDFLEDDALEAISEQGLPELLGSSLTATNNVALQLRFTAHSTAYHGDSAQMLLFDGDPSTGVPAIAAKVIHPGDHGADGTSIWLDWTPTTIGEHHLYAMLLEGAGGQHLVGDLTVNVLP